LSLSVQARGLVSQCCTASPAVVVGGGGGGDGISGLGGVKFILRVMIAKPAAWSDGSARFWGPTCPFGMVRLRTGNLDV
jgi:hypothetical protein